MYDLTWYNLQNTLNGKRKHRTVHMVCYHMHKKIMYTHTHTLCRHKISEKVHRTQYLLPRVGHRVAEAQAAGREAHLASAPLYLLNFIQRASTTPSFLFNLKEEIKMENSDALSLVKLYFKRSSSYSSVINLKISTHLVRFTYFLAIEALNNELLLSILSNIIFIILEIVRNLYTVHLTDLQCCLIGKLN